MALSLSSRVSKKAAAAFPIKTCDKRWCGHEPCVGERLGAGQATSTNLLHPIPDWPALSVACWAPSSVSSGKSLSSDPTPTSLIFLLLIPRPESCGSADSQVFTTESWSAMYCRAHYDSMVGVSALPWRSGSLLSRSETQKNDSVFVDVLQRFWRGRTSIGWHKISPS